MCAETGQVTVTCLGGMAQGKKKIEGRREAGSCKGQCHAAHREPVQPTTQTLNPCNVNGVGVRERQGVPKLLFEAGAEGGNGREAACLPSHVHRGEGGDR